MADKIEELKIVLSGDSKSLQADIRKARRALEEYEKSVEGVDRSQDKLGRSNDSLGLKWTELASKISLARQGFAVLEGAARLTFDTLQRGGNLTNLQRGFESLKSSTGAYSLSLEGLQKASQGLVGSTQLLTQANTAMTLGLPGDELEEIIGATLRLARAQGVDATRAIESFVTGSARQSKLMLDNIGLLVSAEEANEKYAEAIGKTVEALTEEERKTAFITLAKEKLIEKSEQVAETQLNAADAAQQLATTFEELKNEAALALVENQNLAISLQELNTRVGEIDLGEFVGDIGDWLSISIDVYNATNDLITSVTTLGGLIPSFGMDLESLSRRVTYALPGGGFFRQLLRAKDAKQDTRDLIEEMMAFQETAIEAVGMSAFMFEGRLVPAIKTTKDELEKARKEKEKFAEGLFKDIERRNQEQLKQEQKAIEEARRARDKAFQNSVDFYGEILTGLIEGDIEDVLTNMLQRAAIQFGAEMLAQLTALALADTGIDLFGGGTNIFTSILGSGADAVGGTGSGIGDTSSVLSALGISAATIGYIAAGAAVAYVAGTGAEYGRSLAGQPQYQFSRDDAVQAGSIFFGSPFARIGYGLDDIFGGDPAVTQFLGMFDPLNAGAYLATSLGFGDIFNFGSGKPPEQHRRDSIRDHLRDIGVLNDDMTFSIFGGGTGSIDGDPTQGTTFDQLLGGAGQLSGFGDVLSLATIGEVDTELSNMWANALDGSNSFSAALLTTNSLLNKLGLDANSAMDLAAQAFLEGRISLEEFNAAMGTLAQLAQNDLPSVEDAFVLLTDTLDGPVSDQIQALGLTFQELAQVGIDSGDELVAYFTDRFGPDVGAAIANLVQGGIDDFSDFSELSAQEIQLLANNLYILADALGIDMADGFTQMADASSQATQSVNRDIDEMEGKFVELGRTIRNTTDDKIRFGSAGSTSTGGGDDQGIPQVFL